MATIESDRLRGEYTGCAIGAYVNGMENIGSFEAASGRKLAVVLWYVHWREPFPSAEAAQVEANGSLPLITWEPWITGQTGTLEAIASGTFESYMIDFLTAAKNYGRPVFLRFAHEMNGNWYPWDGWSNGQAGGPQRYKQAWIYLYDLRARVRADNVYLVWCPNHTDQPDEPWNKIAQYYPGDQYVDWVGMDGYNWGYSAWQSFDSIFDQCYRSLAALTGKPIMIGEFAAAEPGGDKAAWISDAMKKIENDYTRIKLFCWFNINKERDWRITSCASSETAFRNALQNSYFLDRI